MKAALLLCVLLVGCKIGPPDESVTPERFAIATKACEPHQGLRMLKVWINSAGNGQVISFCNDGTTVIVYIEVKP